MTVYDRSYVSAGARSAVDNHAAVDTHAAVDIAGTSWPLYKLRALAFGIVAALLIFAATTTAQYAVLGGAAVTVVTWWALRLSGTGLLSGFSTRR